MVTIASLQDKMGVHVFCVACRNSLPVTWVTRCLQGDLGGCFWWSLHSVGLCDLKESTLNWGLVITLG